ALFILRSFDDLDTEIVGFMRDTASDETLVESLARSTVASVEHDDGSEDDPSALNILGAALTEHFLRSLGTYLTALETGINELAARASNSLRRSLKICDDLNLV